MNYYDFNKNQDNNQANQQANNKEKPKDVKGIKLLISMRKIMKIIMKTKCTKEI